MVETRVAPVEITATATTYRRISGFAIIGMITGAVYLVSILLAGLWGLIDRSPLLLQPWIQAIPVVSGVMCLLAIVFINNSEGTLAGLKLAKWGGWLSLIAAGGYWAYYGATYMAVNNQAERFVMAWFEKLKQDRLNEALLDTAEPAIRARLKLNPSDQEKMNVMFKWMLSMGTRDGRKNPVDILRTNEVVRITDQGRESTKVVPSTIREWDYKQGGYRIKRVYELSTDEATYEVSVSVAGFESKTNEFAGRMWHVTYSELKVMSAQPTPMGATLAQLKRDAGQFILDWGGKFTQGNLPGAYSDTLTMANREKMATVYACRLLLPPLASGTVMPHGSVGLKMQGWLRVLNFEFSREFVRQTSSKEIYPLFQKSNLVVVKDLPPDDKEMPGLISLCMERMMGSSAPGPVFGRLRPKDLISKRWTYEDGVLKIPLDFEFGFILGPNHYLQALAAITVESNPGPLELTGRSWQWRIAKIDVYSAQDSKKMSPMGPGMPTPGQPGGIQMPAMPGLTGGSS